MSEPTIVRVPPEQAGHRLDTVLAALLPERSRAAWQDAVSAGYVTVDGRQGTKPAQKVGSGQVISLSIPAVVPRALPPNMTLPVIYQDDDLLVIDKPAGVVVHPAPGWTGATVVEALLGHDLLSRSEDGEVDDEGDPTRPGIVHRLDKDTSGLLVVARHRTAQAHLAAQFKERAVRKRYWALVEGHPRPTSGAIEAPIGRDPHNRSRMAVVSGGRPSRTTYRTRQTLARHALLDVGLETGRTHQIRVHLAAVGYPVAGDQLYGVRPPSIQLGRQFLHAYHLEIDSPTTGQRLVFESPLPPDLAALLAGAQETLP